MNCSSRYPFPPKTLEKCSTCSEYKGIVYGHKTPLETLDVLVQCLCDGVLCRNCKKNKVHRPTSNYFDEISGVIWHAPYFNPCICGECQPIIDQRLKEQRLRGRREYVREARALARHLRLRLLGIYDHGMESDIVLKYQLTGEKILARKERVIWKISGEIPTTIETFGGFKQIFLRRMPKDSEILSPNEWINKPNPFD